ncbi:translocation/assembly module TamB domain-containing protein [Fischerella sp. PCC 9605]|uniref:translocation/assembly module TamB domain-containing protein n=1 Tax=Fischerella sp. PCC 9605 TaxID=1173024 RepID=UPI00047E2E16|nr:translocation/assembly module TamB domain-containing protein [Fischerella sp. PCC 9605]
MTGTVQFNGDRIIVPSIQAQYNREFVTASGILPIFATPQTQQQATNNPLTISMNDLNVDLAGLYQGGVSGNAVITGTALSPNLGGTIRLSDGKILVGGTEAAPTSKPANTTTANATPSTQSPID